MLRKVLFLLLGCFLESVTAFAGDYKIGIFEFDLPGTWEARTSETELVATQGSGNSMSSTLLKIELCVPTESKPCKAVMFFPPTGANPENYYCGGTQPTTRLHESGLREMRKICSLKQAATTTHIGMLYLTARQSNLGLILLSGEHGPLPSEFLDRFLSSVVVE